MPDQLWLPVQLCELANEKKLIKPLQILLYLKLNSSGKIHETSPLWLRLHCDLKMKDKRTFLKHFQALLEVGWVGWNLNSGYFFIKSMRSIVKECGFKGKQCSIVFQKDLPDFQIYISSVIISHNIRKQQHYWEFRSKRNQAATCKKEVASKPGSFTSPPKYYGLSNKAIGEELSCRQTRACQLKKKAAKSGYVKIKPHVDVLLTLSKPDHAIRDCIYESHPRYITKLRFRKKRIKGIFKFQLVQQLYDEIIPCIKFKSKKFN